MEAISVLFPEPNRVTLQREPAGAAGPGQVLCSAVASLIGTGTETTCLRGVFDPGTNWAAWVRYPFRPGYSMVARVTAVGQDVSELHEGDLVLTRAPHASHFVWAASQADRIPPGVAPEEATWGVLAVTTQIAVRRAGHALGERVGVVGLGILGQLVTQYVALSGARQIVAIDLAERRLALAAGHGATHCLCLDVAATREPVRELTGGAMLDVVYDVTGHPAVLACCVGLVRKLGRVVLLGDCPTPTQQCLGPGVVSDAVTIIGSHGSTFPEQASPFAPWTRGAMTQLFFDYLLAGRMGVADLITRRAPATDAPELYAALQRDRSGEVGVLLEWAGL